MQEDDLDVHVLPVLVEEVLQEVRDRLVGDVAANHNVPAAGKRNFRKPLRNSWWFTIIFE